MFINIKNHTEKAKYQGHLIIVTCVLKHNFPQFKKLYQMSD